MYTQQQLQDKDVERSEKNYLQNLMNYEKQFSFPILCFFKKWDN